MSNHPSSPRRNTTSTVPDGALLAAIEALQEAQQRVVQAAAAFADDPAPGGPAEVELRAALDARDEAAHQAGVALARWLAAGGAIELVPPATKDYLVPLTSAPPGSAPTSSHVDHAAGDAPGHDPDAPDGDDHDDALDGDTSTSTTDADDHDKAPADPVEPAKPSEPRDITEALAEIRKEERDNAIARLTTPTPRRSAPAVGPRTAADALPDLVEDDQPPSAAAPATSNDLLRLQEWVEHGADTDADGDAAVDGQGEAPMDATSILCAILDLVEKPRRVKTEDDYREEHRRLVDAVELLPAWVVLDRYVQKYLVGLVAARLRHLQDEVHELAPPGASLDLLFATLTAYSAEQRPGFVYGLSRRHEPEGSTWVDDARRWWAELEVAAGRAETAGNTDEPEAPPNPDRALHRLAQVAGDDEVTHKNIVRAALACLDAGVPSADPRYVKTLLPHRKLLTRERRLKATRRAIRDYGRMLAVEGQQAEADGSVIPQDWPHWDKVGGAKVLLIGGERREKAEVRLVGAFGLTELVWDTGWNTRRLDALADQVAGERYDLVVMLARFMNHASWYSLVPTCKDAEVPFVLVERGYGVSQVKAAMEAAWGAAQGGVAWEAEEGP